MLSDLLSAEFADIAKAVAFAAVFLFVKSRQACVVLLAHAVCEFAYISQLSPFTTALSISILYATIAASQITIKSEIRYLFIMIAAVNWLCALDILRSPTDATYFSVSYTYLINALDVLIIYHLLPPRRLNFVNGRFSLGTGRTSCL